MARQSPGSIHIPVTADGRQAVRTFKEVGDAARRLPDSFSKAATAVSALEGATGGLGSSVLRTTGQLSGLASLVGMGGPLGIGLAALSGIVWAVSAAYSALKDNTEELVKAKKKLLEANKEEESSLTTEKKKLGELNKQLKDYGMSQRGILLGEKREALRLQNDIVKKATDEIFALQQKEYATKTLSAADKDHLTLTQDKLRIAQEMIPVLKGELDAINNIAREESKAKADEEAKAKAVKAGEAAAADAEKRRQARARRAEKDAAEEAKRKEEAYKNEQKYLSDLEALFGKHNAAQAKAREKDDELKKRALEDLAREQERLTEEMARNLQSVATEIRSGLGTALSDMADGTKDAGEAFADMFKGFGKAALNAAADYVIAEGIKRAAKALTTDSGIAADGAAAASALTTGAVTTAAAVTEGTTKIGVAASTAAAKGVESASWLPFPYNLIAAAIAGATLFALVMSFKKFHSGGVVEGSSASIPGLGPREVPIIAEIGETYLTAAQTKTVTHALRQSGGGVTINIAVRSLTGAVPTADLSKMAKHVTRATKRAQRLKMVG